MHWRRLFFCFAAKDLYRIDFMSAHRFIHEDLVKYADCNRTRDEIGTKFACVMKTQYSHHIPTNFTDAITFMPESRRAV